MLKKVNPDGTMLAGLEPQVTVDIPVIQDSIVVSVLDIPVILVVGQEQIEESPLEVGLVLDTTVA